MIQVLDLGLLVCLEKNENEDNKMIKWETRVEVKREDEDITREEESKEHTKNDKEKEE